MARRRRVGRRSINQLKPRKTFLLVCQGKVTEPIYFKSFRSSIEIKVIAKSPSYIVQGAKSAAADKNYDQVWCVFDKDDFTDEEFNSAIQEATNNGHNVAYSNECFELWYILHFNYHTAGIDRGSYTKILSKHLERTYSKTDPGVAEFLQTSLSTAIQNASRLLRSHGQTPPAQANPSTTVHLLVQELLKDASD